MAEEEKIDKQKFLNDVHENQRIIQKICHVYCDNTDDRDDLRQEIILQLWHSYPKYRREAKFSTWMYQIAFNTAITNLKRSKRNPEMRSLSSDEKINIDSFENNCNQDNIETLYKSISYLSEVDKAIIMLYLDKKSYEEIGYILGITLKNVGVKLTRIRKKLRAIYNNIKA